MKARLLPFFHLLVSLAMLAGCESRPPAPAHASRAYADAALALAAPSSDRARVFVFNGMQQNKGRWIVRSSPSDVYVDGKKIGTVASMQVMVFDVIPTTYEFSWQGRSYSLVAKPVPSIHTLAGGSNLLMQADLDGMRYMMSPVHGEVYLTADRRVSPDFEVVRPTDCPPTICAR
jgi:hypothetical protein